MIHCVYQNERLSSGLIPEGVVKEEKKKENIEKGKGERRKQSRTENRKLCDLIIGLDLIRRIR